MAGGPDLLLANGDGRCSRAVPRPDGLRDVAALPGRKSLVTANGAGEIKEVT